MRYLRDGGYETEERFEVTAGADEADLNEAFCILEQACKPMDRREIIKSLAVLKALTAKRNEADDDQELQLGAYARQLEDYPADVVRHVLETQPRMSKWWPAWAELHERLELFSARRKRMLDAVMRA